jgi:hypothetical protein
MNKLNLLRGWGATLLLALFTAGCSGINASKSVSPLDLLLPGLILAPPGPTSPAATNSPHLVAQIRP